MATFNSATDESGKSVVRCFVKGAAPAVIDRTTSALAGGASVPWDDDLKKRAEDAVDPHGGRGTSRHGRRRSATSTPPPSTPRAICWATSPTSR